jgi:hypothetical protein
MPTYEQVKAALVARAREQMPSPVTEAEREWADLTVWTDGDQFTITREDEAGLT